jgi:DNA-nicking Smr family endonuclease
MAPKKTKAGDRRPSPDEDALWRHVVRATAPLRRPVGSHFPTSSELPVQPIQPRHGRVSNRSMPIPPIQPAPPGPPSGGLDKRSAQRLKRGRMAIEGRLDLHGMTLDQAHGALDQFIDRAHRASKRCLLVITGKGRRPDEYQDDRDRGPRGVLRDAVPRWLAAGSYRDQVLSVEPARPQHGGDGALYVLLRRKRA